jgi:hypothetical protein
MDSQIKAFFDSAAGHWTSYVMALSLIGGITTALLQQFHSIANCHAIPK